MEAGTHQKQPAALSLTDAAVAMAYLTVQSAIHFFKQSSTDPTPHRPTGSTTPARTR